MGALEGKSYAKGSQHNFQPRIVEQLTSYKTQQRISSSSNIHSVISFTRPRSEHTTVSKVAPRKSVPKKQKIDDIQRINEEQYDDYKFMTKKIQLRSHVNLDM